MTSSSAELLFDSIVKSIGRFDGHIGLCRCEDGSECRMLNDCKWLSRLNDPLDQCLLET
jgi:hypothetical protein